MNLQQAKSLRDKKINMIDQEDADTGFTIMDVIVEPLTNIDQFRKQYFIGKRNREEINNDSLLNLFPSKDYRVSVVLSSDGEWIHISFDDIDE